jgi:DNA helicase-2/ATP-dependent DNA helicase PcrA
VRGDQGRVDLYSEQYEVRASAQRNLYTGKTYNSVENIRQFFAERGMPAPQGLAAPAQSQEKPQSPGTSPVTGHMASAAAKPVVAAPAFAGQSAAAPAKKKKVGPGSTIEHAKYGRGTVLRMEGSGEDTKVTVNFPGYGLKKLIAKYAGIKIE